ncbi:MAG: hypothetical protein IIX78_06290, partial [Alistipes sp.]|nr:hypothetical protein [Alistipes sp.]
SDLGTSVLAAFIASKRDSNVSLSALERVHFLFYPQANSERASLASFFSCTVLAPPWALKPFQTYTHGDKKFDPKQGV